LTWISDFGKLGMQRRLRVKFLSGGLLLRSCYVL